MQDTNGAFYGTTFLGGSNWDGTLFKLSVGLSGATAPTFNWVPASFQVNSDNLIEAQVRAGATTGTVLFTTPNGTLASNLVFTIPD